ncbi:hypothetical protein LXL04_018899 [Taraxacum kok-saghyz]
MPNCGQKCYTMDKNAKQWTKCHTVDKNAILWTKMSYCGQKCQTVDKMPYCGQKYHTVDKNAKQHGGTQNVHHFQGSEKKVHLLLPSSKVLSFKVLQLVKLACHVLDRISTCHDHRIFQSLLESGRVEMRENSPRVFCPSGALRASWSNVKHSPPAFSILALAVSEYLDEKLEVDIVGSRGGSFGPLALSTCNEIDTLDHKKAAKISKFETCVYVDSSTYSGLEL